MLPSMAEPATMLTKTPLNLCQTNFFFRKKDWKMSTGWTGNGTEEGMFLVYLVSIGCQSGTKRCYNKSEWLMNYRVPFRTVKSRSMFYSHFFKDLFFIRAISLTSLVHYWKYPFFLCLRVWKPVFGTFIPTYMVLGLSLAFPDRGHLCTLERKKLPWYSPWAEKLKITDHFL